MDDLNLKVDKLTKYWDCSFIGSATVSPGVFSASPSSSEQTIAPTSADNTAAQPNGHHVVLTPRADGIGGLPSQFHSPANGMALTQSVDSSLLHGIIPMEKTQPDPPEPTHFHPHEHNHQLDNGRLPKLNFPSMRVKLLVYGSPRPRIILRCMRSLFTVGLGSPICISRALPLDGLSHWKSLTKFLGLISAKCSTINLDVTNVIGCRAKCFTSTNLAPSLITLSAFPLCLIS